MEVNKIQEELARLTQLVEGWAGSRDISGIERDLALDKLKKLYEAVRFADFNGEPVAASVSAPKPVEEPIAKEMPEPEISIDLDDLLAEPIRNSEPEPEVAPIPEVKAEPVADSPDTPAEAPSPVANEEPVAEESAAASVAPVTIDTPAEPEPKIASDATPEKGLAESSAVADSGQKEDGAVSNSLFDLDDLVIRHREKRRVIMSLYETDGPQEAAPKGVSEPKMPVREQAPVTSPQPKAKPEKMEETASERPQSAPVKPQEKAAAPEMPKQQPAKEKPLTVVMEISGEQESTIDIAVSGVLSEQISMPDPVPVSVETRAPKHSFRPEPEPVLGEVMGSDVHTLADTLVAPKDMASEIVRKERITDLKQAIGVNDKFLLMRDLFNGDTLQYEQAIERLNAFDDLDDCIIYISENYDWNPSSDGVRFLMELLERKLS